MKFLAKLGQFCSWLVEELIIHKIIEGIIKPFLNHPVKRIFATGGVIIVFALILLGKTRFDDLLKCFDKPGFIVLILGLIIAEVLDKIVYPPQKRTTKKSKYEGI